MVRVHRSVLPTLAPGHRVSLRGIRAINPHLDTPHTITTPPEGLHPTAFDDLAGRLHPTAFEGVQGRPGRSAGSAAIPPLPR
jgi:hypothetical protein